jgi:hypothetical protein
MRIALDRLFDQAFLLFVAKDLRLPVGVFPDLPTMTVDGQPRVQLPAHLPRRDEGDVIDSHGMASALEGEAHMGLTLTNYVRTLFTSVGNEADRVEPT